jgi:molybdopterin-guanine dinucleotide biosynthesis protein A
MLIIGAAGRNAGKTEFACGLIRRYARTETVVGVKITTIKEKDGKCPRGGEGCGVCSSLTGNYRITEERDGPANKDTVRMLRAGAKTVFWLQVLQEHLEEGMRDLLNRIPEKACIVCESNSARSVVDPGLFIVIQEAGSTAVKESCRKVIGLADRVVFFHGTGWDFRPQQMVFDSGRWKFSAARKATAIILSGGKSRRMGRDKSLLEIEGFPMIERIAATLRPLFDELLISANDVEKYRFLGLPVVPDEQPDQGPLMGILSGLKRSSNDLNFVIACDVPDPDPEMIASMIDQADGVDAVMPKPGEERYEPLIAVYRKSVIPHAEKILADGQRKITALFDLVKVRFIDRSDSRWNRNLNTADDYRNYLNEGGNP